MNLREWLAGFPHSKPEELAKELIGKHRSVAIGIIAHEIEHLRRKEVQENEAEEFFALMKHLKPAKSSPQEPTVLGAGFTEFLSELFALGDGQKTTWGEATIEQHEQRVRMLRLMKEGIEKTIERHEMAIQELRGRKLACLNDLVRLAA